MKLTRPRLLAPEWLKAWFLLLGGVAMLGGSLWFALEADVFLDQARQTRGQVVGIVSKPSSRGMDLYHPRVRFEPLEGGNPIEFVARPGLWPSPFDVGDTVAVAYPPGQPEAARVVSFWTLWLMPMLLAAFGLACVAAGWSVRASLDGRSRDH